MPFVLKRGSSRPFFQIGHLSKEWSDKFSVKSRAEISRVFHYAKRKLAPDEIPEALVLDKRAKIPDIFRSEGGLRL